MGFFSKLFHKKKDIAKQIKDKNEESTLIDQKKFDSGLKNASSNLNSSLKIIGKKFVKVDQQLIEDIEEALISFDIGVATTKKILNSIVEEIKLQNVNDGKLIQQIIVDKLFIYYIQDTDVVSDMKIVKGETNVILVSGCNGVGKTTSIAKMCNFFLKMKYSVCLIAGDTFRAGAVAQLDAWANKLGVKIFKPVKEGQDPASVVFEGLTFANKEKIDIVICDTSGRLQNKVNLMNELKKIDSIIKKFNQNQPVESLLVLDATSGQNGIIQTKGFSEITKLTGIILTKMDSSSKGGIVLSIKDAFNLPIKFIGFGEKLDDLKPFDLEMYVTGLVNELDFLEK
ncbi:MAG: signal recognition particle-docking protein FtsY [Mycoplasmoidaceae bacterium]|nr:MAG: signal recognition particle-docking protein FtsY [Mycoplasmoidaceae bacterium]